MISLTEKIFTYFFLFIPLFLITGPAAPDIIITLCVIFGIFYFIILKEYRKAKSITEKRLYLETMEKVLPDIEKIIVPDKNSGNMLNLLNLNTGKTAGGKKQ